MKKVLLTILFSMIAISSFAAQVFETDDWDTSGWTQQVNPAKKYQILLNVLHGDSDKYFVYNVANNEKIADLKEGVNVFDFKQPVTEFGIAATTPHLIYSGINDNSKFVFYHAYGISDAVSYGKLSDMGSGNHQADFTVSTMGSPLPTPITTLLICCGFASLAFVYKKREIFSK